MELNYDIGMFQDDYGYWYKYKNTSDPWALANGLPHELVVCGTLLFGRITPTVAYVATHDGNATCEAWNIKKHHVVAS